MEKQKDFSVEVWVLKHATSKLCLAQNLSLYLRKFEDSFFRRQWDWLEIFNSLFNFYAVYIWAQAYGQVSKNSHIVRTLRSRSEIAAFLRSDLEFDEDNLEIEYFQQVGYRVYHIFAWSNSWWGKYLYCYFYDNFILQENPFNRPLPSFCFHVQHYIHPHTWILILLTLSLS